MAGTNFVEALAPMLIIALLLFAAFLLAGLAHPSAQLFRDMTQVGAAIFVAYAIAIAGLRPLKGESLTDHRDFLWGGIGIGLGGLFALGLGLALAAYRQAGHESLLDIAGLCWMISALALMGGMVTIYPILAWQERD